jgi:hypothetical protein
MRRARIDRIGFRMVNLLPLRESGRGGEMGRRRAAFRTPIPRSRSFQKVHRSAGGFNPAGEGNSFLLLPARSDKGFTAEIAENAEIRRRTSFPWSLTLFVNFRCLRVLVVHPSSAVSASSAVRKHPAGILNPEGADGMVYFEPDAFPLPRHGSPRIRRM